MNETLIKILIDVYLNFPLLMALVLIIDYKINGKYDIEFEVIDYDEIKNEDKLIFKLVEKFNDVVNNND